MSEEGNAGSKTTPQVLGRKTAAWIGGVISLGLLSIILLYAYGDPRPTSVAGNAIGGQATGIPTVAPREQYYRIRGDYFPLAPASATADPIGQMCAAVFGEAVSRAGAAAVRLRLSHPAALALPKDSDGYLLLDIPLGGAAASGVTPYIVRQPEDNVDLRVDVEMSPTETGGLLPRMLRAFAGTPDRSSGWVSVFSEGASTGRQVLSDQNAVFPVRDFSNRVVGAVRLGLEVRSSLLFTRFFEGGEFERLVVSGAAPEARRSAVLSAIDAAFPEGMGEESRKAELRARASAHFAYPEDTDRAAICRQAFSDLSQAGRLSSFDAAVIAMLVGYDAKASLPPDGDVCGDPGLTSVLARSGMKESLERASRAMASDAEAEKARKAVAREVTGPEAHPPGSYICLGVSGPRIARHCETLNAIAREWRGGAKFLHMKESRRYIGETVGLEEPTGDMRYSAARFTDRRQLLIHVALSRVTNFACFRMIRENPDYFEALLIMSEPGAAASRRVDVFEFAFDSDGTIGRIRRRAALPSDIEAARALPSSSRCRRGFLDPNEAAIRRLVGTYWRLPVGQG